jgi:hypothetical protein
LIAETETPMLLMASSSGFMSTPEEPGAELPGSSSNGTDRFTMLIGTSAIRES